MAILLVWQYPWSQSAERRNRFGDRLFNINGIYRWSIQASVNNVIEIRTDLHNEL